MVPSSHDKQASPVSRKEIKNQNTVFTQGTWPSLLSSDFLLCSVLSSLARGWGRQTREVFLNSVRRPCRPLTLFNTRDQSPFLPSASRSPHTVCCGNTRKREGLLAQREVLAPGTCTQKVHHWPGRDGSTESELVITGQTGVLNQNTLHAYYLLHKHSAKIFVPRNYYTETTP